MSGHVAGYMRCPKCGYVAEKVVGAVTDKGTFIACVAVCLLVKEMIDDARKMAVSTAAPSEIARLKTLKPCGMRTVISVKKGSPK